MSRRENKEKQRELDELRKLGVAPAAEDEHGFYINPHIPAYMSEAPWYMDKGVAGLYHQRLGTLLQGKKPTDTMHKVVKKGLKRSRARRWVKGACENCGSRTHKTRNCVERPRKRKAKFSNKNIAFDEHIPEALNPSWDGKRDRWANFDVSMHQFEIKKWQKVEEMRREKREQELSRRMKEGTEEEKKKARKKLNKLHQKQTGKIVADSDSDSDSDTDTDDSDDEMADSGKVIQNFDVRHRQTVRNLRIREDLPKYLRNLHPDSAFYDPKTRSMRANPYAGGTAKDIDVPDDYSGDLTIMNSGETGEFNLMQKFTLKTQEHHGLDVAGNMLLASNPTSTELAFKNFKEKKKERSMNKDLVQKYGGEEHIVSSPKMKSNEIYTEYLPDGRLKEQAKFVPKSKYVEDEHPGSHTSVFGSYFDIQTQAWGYTCCKATAYSAYCTNVGKSTAKTVAEVKPKDGNRKKRVMSAAAKPKEFFDEKKKRLKSGYMAVRGVASQAKIEAGLTDPNAS